MEPLKQSIPIRNWSSNKVSHRQRNPYRDLRLDHKDLRTAQGNQHNSKKPPGRLMKQPMNPTTPLASEQSSELIEATAKILMFVGRVGLYIRHRARHVKSPDGDACVALGDSLHNFERFGRRVLEKDIKGSLNELALLGCAISNSQALADLLINEVGSQAVTDLRHVLAKSLLVVKEPADKEIVQSDVSESDAANALGTH